ncbi:hypothetical protein H696_00876 [Fonticula alba]|uniref:RRM domain-containing protein n=1 Tax=Fonticula alba TaxID=691883 RepID=A0A058ZIJ1_FONAL|nr:hypothetical protein H696_00876 [Fonticula alba]KCV73337.1 hypothetical protein H696_00876 [Fonticula alba]|eukprot:XP_009493038.1 hypothetical protein H696_00876 [Fonticula alba]
MASTGPVAAAAKAAAAPELKKRKAPTSASAASAAAGKVAKKPASAAANKVVNRQSAPPKAAKKSAPVKKALAAAKALGDAVESEEEADDAANPAFISLGSDDEEPASMGEGSDSDDEDDEPAPAFVDDDDSGSEAEEEADGATDSKTRFDMDFEMGVGDDAESRARAEKLALLRSRINEMLDTRAKKDGAKEGDAQATGATVRPDRGVVYLSRIPHGFYEPQMFGFFSQFGTVTRIRLSRNPRTGKSRHYAWIEFEVPEVARIVADSMHFYLLGGRLLRAFFVEKEKLHRNTFRGAVRSAEAVKLRRGGASSLIAPRRKDSINQRKADAEVAVSSAEARQRRLDRVVERENKRLAKLAAAGVDFTFSALDTFKTQTASRTTFDE